MNITMIYFSQTGNTRRIAEAMAEAFRGGGHATRLISLKKASPHNAIMGDLLGIGTPCFSSQAPTPIKTFLKSLPTMEGRRAFVFATSGGAPGRVLFDLTRLLEDKGADVIGGFLARGELHHPAPCLQSRMPGRPNAEDLAQARHFAAAIIEHVLAGRTGAVAESHPDTFRPGSRFYNLVAFISTDGFLRLVLPEPKPDPTRCNQCQWCVYECPMHNITLQPHPILGDRCIRCYRCLAGCPQKAFAVDWKLANLVILTFYNTLFERWFGDLRPGERIY